MLIVMNANATQDEIDNTVRVVESLGFRAHVMPGATRTAIGVTGNKGAVDLSHFENLPGVAEAIRVTKPYKLITLDLRPTPREVMPLRQGDAARDKSIEFATGFTEEQARREASRCLRCDLAYLCPTIHVINADTVKVARKSR